MGSTQQKAAQSGFFMASSFPVFLPEDPCLHLNAQEFQDYISTLLPCRSSPENAILDEGCPTGGNSFIHALDKLGPQNTNFKSALNRALTDNLGVTFAATKSPLVDLYHNFQSDWSVSWRDELKVLLEKAWEEDSLACLKIIWNTRSIHLGKGDKNIFYTMMGWLKEHHPRTLLCNLQWLFRPVIEKNRKQEEMVSVEIVDSSQVDDYDVVHGVAHGYWKDILNILALSANGNLDMSNPSLILEKSILEKKEAKRTFRRRSRRFGRKPKNSTKNASLSLQDLIEKIQRQNEQNEQKSQEARITRHAREAERHKQILDRLSTDPFHRALHYTVARLFAEALRKDMLLAQTGKEPSLSGKWAPSLEGFHDKHTRVATTIAEILFPREKIGQPSDTRESYLKRAREQYRFWTTSKLRKALGCVECSISANRFSNIKYNRVPSIAMKQYTELFVKKDGGRFDQYLTEVAEGKARISGAVLMPGALVNQATGRSKKVVNLQWKTLVQRIKDCGSLSNSISICDVSGSMTAPAKRSDPRGESLMDIAIGLSLIVSSVTQAPFGGKIITFSRDPHVVDVGGAQDSRTLGEQVIHVRSSNWNSRTDFLKVFRLILAISVTNKVKPEDMVKRMFVFSDMEFDSARSSRTKWETHHEIITREFTEAGYETPELIYWNLSSSSGHHAPVTHDMPGTALVSGHNQAVLKVFLETGSVGTEEEKEEVEIKENTEKETKRERKAKRKMFPYEIMMKAIGHEAYDMLAVVD